MNRYDFENRCAVVTGGAQGIGYAVAERLLESGAKIALWDHDENALGIAKQTLPHPDRIETMSVDITSLNAVQSVFDRTMALFGAIDVLVHSAGIAGPNTSVAEYSVTDWLRVVEVNLNAAFYVNQTVVKAMIARGYGRVVNIASIAGKEGNPNAAAYSASKAGLIGLTKSLGKETAKLDIAVNAVTPAAVRTKIFDQMSQEHIDYMLSKIPRSRFGEVKEIAAMVTWLASQENSFSTGAVFDLSGGRATY